MRFLLDTHTAIWIFQDKNRLSSGAKAVMDDLSAELFISIVSAWEIAIKVSIGKLEFAGGVTGFLETIVRNDINILGISPQSLEVVESLPLHHRDPFDRLLVATARTENLSIITADTNILLYDVNVIW
jgi:PIN domain nuclease of toxin-antitoxin system